MDFTSVRELEARLKDIPQVGHAELELRAVDISLPPFQQVRHLSAQAYSILKGAAICIGLKDDMGGTDFVVADNSGIHLPDMLTEAICATEALGL